MLSRFFGIGDFIYKPPFPPLLQLLGPSTSRLFCSYVHLQRAMQALLQVTELDCSQVKVIAERSSGVMNPSGHIQRPRKYFKHFVDEKIHAAVIRICRLLGYYGDISVIIDHLLDAFHQGPMYRKQVTDVEDLGSGLFHLICYGWGGG